MPKKSRNKGKASSFKLANKHTTKLAKRGELDHQKRKRREAVKLRKSALEKKKEREKDDYIKSFQKNESEDYVIEDEGYFDDADVGFARSILRDDQSGGKKKRKNLSEVESLFKASKRARQWVEEESRPLLPIKQKNKLIERSEKIEQVDEDSVNGDESGDQVSDVEMEETTDEQGVTSPKTEQLQTVSVVDIYAHRATKLKARQAEVAAMSCAIIEDPEANMGKLRALRELWTDGDPSIRTANRKILMMALTEIFKDVLPDYSIRVATQSEKQQAATKEVKQLRQYEENILYNYKMYLQLLEECIGKGTEKQDNQAESAAKTMKLIAVKCMCQVFVKRPSFNFSKNIITVLSQLLTVHNQEIIASVCDAYKQVFREDRSGQISLEIVRSICRIVKSVRFHTDPKVLETFLSLKIKEIITEEERKKTLTHKEKMKQWSRKERRMEKKRRELNKQLEEAAIEVNRNKVLQARTDTITAIFTLYFIILKQAQQSKLLSPVLAGLAKFAHLINVDFFDDLFAVFKKLLDTDILSLKDVLNITQTAFTILSGQGEALNIDPQHFYTHLYRILPLLPESDEGIECVPKVADLVKVMFLDRKKKVTNSRVLAYTKRLISITVHLPTECTLILLTAARSLFTHFPYADVLLDTECVGSGIYRPDLDDPEYCNPQNTTVLYELHLLAQHSDEAVKVCAKQMLKATADHQNNKKSCLICLQTTDELIDLMKEEEKMAAALAGGSLGKVSKKKSKRISGSQAQKG